MAMAGTGSVKRYLGCLAVVECITIVGFASQMDLPAPVSPASAAAAFFCFDYFLLDAVKLELKQDDP